MEYQRENFDGQYDFRSRFHDGWHMGANLHEYSELLYCKSGSGYATVNGRVIPLHEGDLIWIPPNYVHAYDFESSLVICAVFSNDFVPLFFRELRKRYFHVAPVPMREAESIIEKLPHLKKSDTLQICGYLNLICAEVLKSARFDEDERNDGGLYQRVVLYLSEQFGEDITLASLARELGYNKKYLSHALHELTGIHFRQLLNLYRINYAKELLAQKKTSSISSISEECGFGALNTFNREFKRVVGVTPREYRSMLA